MAKRAGIRRKSEFPRHRAGTDYSDRTLPYPKKAAAAGPDTASLPGPGLDILPEAPFIGPLPMPEGYEEPVPETPEPEPEDEQEQITYPENYLEISPDVNGWFQNIIQECMDIGASDVLLSTESERKVLTVQARVDGRMRPIRRVEGLEARQIVGKFKSGSGLSTGVSFIPEETIYMVDVDGEERKARVVSFHTADGGDAIVLRLPPAGALRRLSELSFSPLNKELFEELLGAANRMIVIAGPMGSGKTTTAHGALMHVSTGTRTVWTVEDPVERNLPGLIQLEVDEENNAGFDALLPALVRSDYDTLFIGEIRDNTTAAAAVRQAKAGRQVITTIHANNNVTALLRLIDLAEDSPLSVLDSVKGVVSQRLIGRLNADWDGRDPMTKYKGRVPIHEVLTITDAITEAIMANVPLSRLRAIAEESSRSTFRQDVERLIADGITDREEARRVLGG
ncbi:GspE/PulE family protein [Arthrobacter caoxuetaonis]|uniref:Flp pilus assembly complex ATPase component TadA n=1 Tax=Arthrobacter caoxuetaonis TaxID=2886935 RepID=A0A9X1MG82_9MICC|nr:ATPase, T2SS/T4P/T4SS family [Arthrobacter caoxuetaonis]MCC3299241.1 Flp pilus assembly complex ATPase component TadA [Arthrobacter caoxuetaonis]USQ59265.1 Flp pilus assembly complex ATPase component TadA [Arthrobacter caoxuetaonis]